MLQLEVTQRVEVGKHSNSTNKVLGLTLDYINKTHHEISIKMEK